MDLITLEEYKAYKKIGNPEKDDVLQAIISSVSNLIKVYCGRTFIDYYSTPKTEIQTVKPGRTAIILEEIPLGVISAVNNAGTDITANITIDTQMGVIFKSDGGYFTPGTDIVSITYTGGFEETPADIKLAAFELTDYYANSEHTARKTFGGTSVEYHPDKNAWPYHIQSILDMYRDL